MTKEEVVVPTQREIGNLVSTDPNHTTPEPPAPQPSSRLELVINTLLVAAGAALGRALGSALAEQLLAAFGWAG